MTCDHSAKRATKKSGSESSNGGLEEPIGEESRVEPGRVMNPMELLVKSGSESNKALLQRVEAGIFAHGSLKFPLGAIFSKSVR